jgi:hypothetical protein
VGYLSSVFFGAVFLIATSTEVFSKEKILLSVQGPHVLLLQWVAPGSGPSNSAFFVGEKCRWPIEGLDAPTVIDIHQHGIIEYLTDDPYH